MTTENTPPPSEFCCPGETNDRNETKMLTGPQSVTNIVLMTLFCIKRLLSTRNLHYIFEDKFYSFGVFLLAARVFYVQSQNKLRSNHACKS